MVQLSRNISYDSQVNCVPVRCVKHMAKRMATPFCSPGGVDSCTRVAGVGLSLRGKPRFDQRLAFESKWNVRATLRGFTPASLQPRPPCRAFVSQEGRKSFSESEKASAKTGATTSGKVIATELSEDDSRHFPPRSSGGSHQKDLLQRHLCHSARRNNPAKAIQPSGRFTARDCG